MRTLFISLLLLAATVSAQELKVTVEKYDVPKYVPIAMSARIQGDVVLFLTLNRDGSVDLVKVEKGHLMFVPLSVESAKKWKFHCWECSFPEGFKHKLTFSFTLMDDCSGNEYRHSFRFPDSVSVFTCPPLVQTVSSH